MIKITQQLKFIGIALLATMQMAYAQTKIGGSAGPGDASAVLELQSTGNNQGFLPPRLTTAQRNAITTPATGLTIYNTDDQCLNVYKGSTNGWFNMCSGGGGFSFTNCASPTVTGTIGLGAAASATVTLNYVNNTGQLGAAFQSGTASGLTLTATGGTVSSLTAGSGSIVLTVTGTPTVSGTVNIPISLAGTYCSVPVTVAGCSDPGSTQGNTGCVVFTYKGAQVVYSTVRAKDGKIWLRQNVGAAGVAATNTDANGFGDFFQWGRWDDGHQTPTSIVAAASTLSPNNPSGLGTGSTTFYTQFWSGGVSSDTWSGSTTASTTAGKDPCTAMGSGWHLPTTTEWTTMMSAEGITNMATAYTSNLKIPYQSGYRDWSSGSIVQRGSAQGGWYWTGTAFSTAGFGAYINTGSGGAGAGSNQRGFGFEIRCLK